MRETRGALGRLATKSLHLFIFFFDKRGDKSVACMSVCACVSHNRGFWDMMNVWSYAPQGIWVTDRQTDRGGMNDIRIHSLEQRIHIFCWALNAVCVCLCVRVLYLFRKPFTQMQASEALIDIWRSFHFIKSKSMFVFRLCAHVGGVRVCVSATNEVLNYKALRYGGIVCYSSVWVLSYYGRSWDDKPLISVTWQHRLHKHTHTRGDCGFIHSHDKALAAESLPSANIMAFLSSY